MKYDPMTTVCATRSLMTPAAAVSSAAVRCCRGMPAADARPSTRRIAPGFSAMIVAAEGTRTHAALAASRRVSASRRTVAFEGSRPNSGTERRAAPDSTAIVITAVVKGPAPGEVPAVVIDGVVVMPVESPVAPAPTETSEPADTKAESERKIGPAEPDSGIRIPSRPRNDGIAVYQPRVIGGNIDHVRLGGINVDIGAVLLYDLLGSALQIPSLFCFVAHHLDRIRHVLLLIVVSVSQRRRPREILVHVSQDGRKRCQRLDARVPGLLIHGLPQGLALQIGMSLHPSV